MVNSFLEWINHFSYLRFSKHVDPNYLEELNYNNS